jgi:hypothetical protein
MQATLKGVNQLTLLLFVNRLVVEMLFGCANLLCVQGATQSCGCYFLFAMTVLEIWVV